jgi:transketolase
VPPLAADIERGGYVRVDGEDIVVVATGSEVPLAEDAASRLAAHGISARVVSVPCVEVFNDQPDEYRAAVLGSDLPVFTIEAGSTAMWNAVARNGGMAIGIDHFGASAPASVLAQQYGFTPEAVAATIIEELSQS